MEPFTFVVILFAASIGAGALGSRPGRWCDRRAGASLYFLRGDINPFIAAPVAPGVLLGTTNGTRLLLRLRGAVIRKVLVIVLAVVAPQMIWRGIEGTIR